MSAEPVNVSGQRTSDETVAKVRGMQQACQAYGVPLAAAALQFSFRDPRVASTIVGISNPERVEETLRLAGWPIPDELWGKLLPDSAAEAAAETRSIN